ncbi:alpha/beta hydrolase [Pseudovibrio exalbescens]|uniref:alpha/beta fold hydrolase n=1 Tax=Pseudovibrio exalbescens TaxID=197461 RepID=UPI002365C3C1|nr:alpha/beta hydrolase [Pseudovibrio exalbescens]MDD7910864.1 alpha/beta hydrolase [Pseudovibrio exalbescens]
MRTSQPTLVEISTPGGQIVAHDWPGSSPPVLLLHATGLHAHCWDYIIRRLPDVRFLAVDARGHGRSQQVNGPMLWDELGEDVVAVLDAVDFKGGFGVGHSMGGALLAYAASQRPTLFQRLLLLDPVLWPPSASAGNPHEMNPEDHPVAGRRSKWRDPDEMLLKFRGKPPYSSWNREVLKDYCQHGLIENGQDGSCQLACNPAREAEVYVNACGTETYNGLADISCETTIVRARDKNGQDGPLSFGFSPTWPNLATAIPKARDIKLTEASHFFPQEQPDSIITMITQMIAGDPLHWTDSEGLYG